MKYMKNKGKKREKTGKRMAKKLEWGDHKKEIKEWSEMTLWQKLFVIAIALVGILIIIHSFTHPIPGNSIAFH